MKINVEDVKENGAAFVASLVAIDVELAAFVDKEIARGCSVEGLKARIRDAMGALEAERGA